MDQKIVVKTLIVSGMTCPSCELRIENKLKKMPGISHVEAKYADGIVHLTFDSSQIDFIEIIETFESLDYTVQSTSKHGKSKKENVNESKKSEITTLLGVGIILFAIYFLIQKTIGFNFIPEINPKMGYGVLFVVGLLTSLHCVAMCGGINLSQCVSYKYSKDDKFSKLTPSILYNLGRVTSYTVIGGIVGALGSVISLSGTAKGLVSIIAGVFMVIMGLNMIDIVPGLRKFMPRMPKIFGNKIHNNQGKKGPFIVGLLNGFMPCGPLQSMQIYALGTGSFISGALSMFLFSLGTVPLMFGFGAISSMLSSKFTKKMMKVSAALVMILGIVMLNRGLSLSGINTFAFGSTSNQTGAANSASVTENVQTITTKITSNGYPAITVQKGIPVKWTIQADANDINGCNNEIVIPKFNIKLKLKPGDNLVEFTPDESGTIPYSCWMGMIRSKITVVDTVTETVKGTNISSTNTQNQSIADDQNTGQGSGYCAASSSATAFANGKIPTDNIQIAQTIDGIQEATVTVNSYGYSPSVIVLQKNQEFKIKFIVEELNGCNSVVNFPDFNGGLDLTKDTETPELTAESDFSFECGMSMLHGYVKVVDDINNFDMVAIKSDVENFTPASGGGCCGR